MFDVHMIGGITVDSWISVALGLGLEMPVTDLHGI